MASNAVNKKSSNKPEGIIPEKLKASFVRVKRMVLLALTLYVIAMIGRFVYKVVTMMGK
jgi:hypothetical protein